MKSRRVYRTVGRDLAGRNVEASGFDPRRLLRSVARRRSKLLRRAESRVIPREASALVEIASRRLGCRSHLY
jgi:hypothetical protein